MPSFRLWAPSPDEACAAAAADGERPGQCQDCGMLAAVLLRADGVWRCGRCEVAARSAFYAGASLPALDLAVASVRRPFAGMLLDGSKDVELRAGAGMGLARRAAALWEPGAGLVGVVGFGRAERLPAESLWRRMAAGGGWLGLAGRPRPGMGAAEFDRRFGGGRVTAVAAAWRRAREPLAPAAVRALLPAFQPPQSWRRLAPAEAAALAGWLLPAQGGG